MCAKSPQSCLTLQPCGLQPTRLLCQWDFLGKSTGVGCHCLLHVNILGIRKLKWTEMREFHSDDDYIYYCGQESLRRNEVAIIVYKRV